MSSPLRRLSLPQQLAAVSHMHRATRAIDENDNTRNDLGRAPGGTPHTHRACTSGKRVAEHNLALGNHRGQKGPLADSIDRLSAGNNAGGFHRVV